MKTKKKLQQQPWLIVERKIDKSFFNGGRRSLRTIMVAAFSGLVQVINVTVNCGTSVFL